MDASTPFSTADLVAGLLVAGAALGCALHFTRNDPERRAVMAALVFKLLAGVAYTWTAFSYYAGVADTAFYHQLGVGMANYLHAVGLPSYLATYPFFLPHGNDSDRFTGLNGLLYFLFQDSFSAVSVVYGVLGFLGQLMLYRVFTSFYPDPRLRPLWRVGILFFPSLTFWSSGMLKDSLGIFGLGLTLWSVHRLLARMTLSDFLLLCLGLYTLLLFRPHVLPVFAVALVPWLLDTLRARPRSAEGARRMEVLVPFVRVGALLIGPLAVWIFLQVNPQYSVSALPQTLANQANLYPGGPQLAVTTSWSGIVQAWPLAMVLVLFRPFIWEAGGLVQWAAALENLVLLVLALRAILHASKYPSAIRTSLGSPLFVSSLIFVALFGLIVGVTTPNLGSVSRYRIPLDPFFVAALIILECRVVEVQRLVEERLTAPRFRSGATFRT